MSLVSPPKAKQIVLNSATKSRWHEIVVECCHGKILAEDIFADCDQPSADKSSMDGIAIAFQTWEKGLRDFKICGMQKAGTAPKTLRAKTGCFEIMTGAVIPKYCDCVIPVENVKITNATASLKPDVKILKGQFIRKQASEYKKNNLLISRGTKINSTHIAVAASIGKTSLKIYSPRIAIVGTGDELIPLNKIPQAHQARRSNTYALEALLKFNGFADVKKFHLKDNLAQIKKGLKRIIGHFDVVILSGGVSMGKFDFIPRALNELKIKTLFHKVHQKPGKPFLFAKSPSGKVVFGLPGNPVSTLVCAIYYVLPFLSASCGAKNKTRWVPLACSMGRNTDLTLFVPVILDDAGLASAVKVKSSGDYNALTKSDGFVEIPNGEGIIKKGKAAKFFSW